MGLMLVLVLLGGIVLGVGGAVLVLLYTDRLGQVGTHAQFHGQFGLEAYEDGPLLTGGLTMGGISLAGLTFLLARLYASGRVR